MPMLAPAIAAGTYTDITDLIAPSSASAGDEVSVTVKIKNLYSASVHVYCVGVLDSEERFIDWLDYWIPAGETHSFNGSFVMPSSAVTIHAYSYYEDVDGYLRYDDEEDKDIRLAVAWQKLATKAVTVTPIAWQKLATIPVTITPVAWQKLAVRTISITPSEVNWIRLATRSITLTPGVTPPPPPPPPPEKKFPWGWLAVGGAGVVALALLAKPKKRT